MAKIRTKQSSRDEVEWKEIFVQNRFIDFHWFYEILTHDQRGQCV